MFPLRSPCPGFVLLLTLCLTFTVTLRAQGGEADECRLTAGCSLTPKSPKTVCPQCWTLTASLWSETPLDNSVTRGTER